MGTTQIGIVWNPSKVEHADLEAALESAVEAIVGGSSDVGDESTIHVTWHETKEDHPKREAAQDAVEAGADVVLVAGGDGTVRAVAEYLAESGTDVDLGIIPLGTGNLLARNLEIPLGDMSGAISRALAGEARTIDMGWAEVSGSDATQRHGFAVMAGFGIDAHMIVETDDDLKDKAGWLAYVESMARAFSASEVIELRITTADGTSTVEPAHTLLVGNCGTLQGGVTILPDADPSDGELDLLVLNADTVSGWADTMRNLIWDNGLRRLIKRSDDDSAQSSESATHRRVTKLLIELGEAREFEVDGDAVGEVTQIEIEVQPAAVRIRS